jgi:uncharacterized protein YsxB (DUF464 family)
MTKIKFFKNDKNLVGFECSGHTGYEEYGKDILCATISGITQSAVLGLTKVIGIDVELERNDKVGLLKVELPKVLSDEELQKAQVILNTVYVSIQDLTLGYSSYISMEVIE